MPSSPRIAPRIAVCALFALSAIAPANPCWADAGPPAFSELSKAERKKRRKKAKRYEKKGKKAYKKGNYDDAIVAFELAYERYPDPRYLFNVGRCHDKLGDLFKAMEFTQRYVGEVEEGEEREDADEMVAMLRAKLVKTSGELSLKTEPEGATVTLSGKERTFTGTTPLRRWLPAGQWKAELTLPGYLPAEREFAVGIGKSSAIEVVLVSEAAAAKAAAEEEAKAKAKAEEEARAKAEAASATEDTAAQAVRPEGAADGAASEGAPMATWIAAGVAVAALGAGFGLSAAVSDKLAERDALLGERTSGGRSEAGALEDDADGLASLGNVAFATGAVALVAAGVTWWLDR